MSSGRVSSVMNPSFREPIAIVGIGCRFVGIDSAADLWRVLVAGRHTLRDTSTAGGRDGHAFGGASDRAERRIRPAAHLDGLWRFDHALFGISADEAAEMEPHQRVLLEVAWRTLEDAGHRLDELHGVRAAVYVGLSGGETDGPLGRPLQDTPSRIRTADRLARAFHLTGPAATLDAGGASSLLAVHLACHAIWSGEVPFALVGGVHVRPGAGGHAHPGDGSSSPKDDRCRFGDAGAQGCADSEGAALVLLAPLGAALAHNDRVYAVLRGTGSAQDGGGGPPADGPSGSDGRAAGIRRVYDAFGLDVNSVRYVEAHGAGEAGEDAAEMEAVARAISTRRARREPVLVGSVGGNIGHAGSVAGLAGLIKAALILHHRQVPASLHVHTPNPLVAWGVQRLALALVPTALPDPTGALVAVNTSSRGGTHVHAVLAAGPPLVETASRSDLWLLPISGQTPEALAGNAARMAEVSTGLDPAAACWTAAMRRTPLSCRAAVVGRDGAELEAGLRHIAAGQVPVGRALRHGRVVFLFGDDGGQWAGMGRTLAERDDIFRNTLGDIDAAFMRVAGWSTTAALADPSGAWMHEPTRARALLFAVQVALAQAWMRRGFRPRAVLGQGLGEVAAAFVCGALDLDDAVRVVTAGIDRAETTGDGFARGPPRPGVQPVSASPSDLLAALRPRSAPIPFVSTVTGAPVDGVALDTTYWQRTAGTRLRRGEALDWMAAEGADVFLELGPHPVMLDEVDQHAGTWGHPVLTVASMRRGEDGRRTMLEAIAAMWTRGVPVRWEWVLPESNLTTLPGYVFTRNTFPQVDQPGRTGAPGGAGDHPAREPPWPGRRVRLDHDPSASVWEILLSTARYPWLGDHRVAGEAVLPPAAYIDLGLAAGRAALGDGALRLEDLEVREPVCVPEDTDLRLQLLLRKVRTGEALLRFTSAPDDGAPTIHAEARVHLGRADVGGGDTEPVAELELARERIAVERRRDEGNPAHGATLLVLDGVRDTGGGARVSACVRGVLRAEDGVFAVGGGRVLVVLDEVKDAGQLGGVAARLQVALDAVGGVSRLQASPIRAVERGDLVEAAMRGALPTLPVRPVRGDGRPEAVDAEGLAASLARRGLLHGPAFRGLRDVERLDDAVQGRITLPACLPAAPPHLVHPALLDACFQLAVAAAGERLPGGTERDPLRTVGARRVTWTQPPRGDLRCRVWSRGTPVRPDEQEFDLTVTDDAHNPVVEVLGLRVRHLPPDRGSVGRYDRVFHRWFWEKGEPIVPAEVGEWEVVAAQAERGPMVRAITQHHGRIGPNGGLLVIPTPGDAASAGDVAAEAHRIGALIGALAPGRHRNVWIVTLGACPVVPGERPDAGGAGVWGMVRGMAHERPDLSLHLADVGDLTTDLPTLLGVMGQPSPPDEVAVRAGRLHLRVLTSGTLPDVAPAEISRQSAMVRIGPAGLTRHPSIEEGAPVLGWILGDEGAALAVLDGPRAAVVVPRVEGRDRLLPAALVPDPDCTVSLPPCPDPLALAGVAWSMLPAVLAVQTLGRVRLGERVLVLGAGTPLGTITSRLANEAGARVITAAGTLAERKALRAGGFEALDERTPGLAAQLRDLTGGEGVDVVLRCSDVPTRGVGRLVATGGRWLDLVAGPADSGFDVPRVRVEAARIAAERPRLVAQELGRVVAMAQRVGWSVPRITPAAWRPGLGLVVLDVGGDAPPVRMPLPSLTLEKDGTYLVSGGADGLAPHLGRFLAERGAGVIVLVCQGGRVDEAALAATRLAGAEVRVLAVDAADEPALRTALAATRAALPPIRGLFHLAGLPIDPSVVGPEYAQSTMPRAYQGALSWDAATRDDPLDHFVLLTSGATPAGPPGRPHDASTVSMLGALAWRRRAQGRVALTVAWEVRDGADPSGLPHPATPPTASGVHPLPPDEALIALEQAILRAPEAEIGIFDLDSTWRRTRPGVGPVATAAAIAAPGHRDPARRDRRRSALVP